MVDNISNRLYILDFLIAVLKQHEKNLDEIVTKLCEMSERLENFSNDGLESRTLTNLLNDSNEIKPIELVVLNLTVKGYSINEIALRLDMNPVNVKEITNTLVGKGYLPSKLAENSCEI